MAIPAASSAHRDSRLPQAAARLGLTPDTLPRPADMADRTDPAVLYVESYLLIRTVVGVLGILLPIVFIVGEAYFLRGGVQLRGSLSAYYFTSMRDIFVGALCVIGFLLATYMAGQPRSLDFWLSLVAGVAVIAVVFFPTTRPGLPAGSPRCGVTPQPPDCSPVQQRFGEIAVGRVHGVAAAVFVLSLAAIAFVFAWRARRYGSPGMARLQVTCGSVIVAAVAFVLVGNLTGLRLGALTPLYLGEVAAVWAFGASWLANGRGVRGAVSLAHRDAVAPPA
jgi:hypothetical protein